MDVDTIRVDLFEQECNTDIADSDGNVWSVETIDGWDAPDQRGDVGDPTAAHGSYVSGIYAAGRVITVTGYVECATQASAWTAYNRISGSLPGILGSGDVVVHEPDVAKSLTVIRSGKPRITDPLKGLVNFQLTLLAEYPWKRAVDAITRPTIAGGASQTFAAVGTFAAEVIVTTTSSGTVDFGAAGLTLRSNSVASGTVFDSLERTVTSSGGADLFGSTLPGIQWPAVAPGPNTFVNNGTADVDLSYFPTFA